MDREVAALQRLRHAGVCRLYGVVHSPTYVYLVMEAGDRDLFAFLDGYPRGCDDGTVCAVMRILALALRHCHNAGVAHRDVKPENVLVVGDPATWGDAEGVVKLCDFGLCADVAGDPRLTDFVGSPGFFAPELMTAESYCGRGADAWSLGAVLVELLLGHRAFEAAWCPPYEELQDPEKFLDGVRRAAARVKLGAAAGPPSEPMAALLEQLVQIDPARRATVADVCGAPVFGLLRDSPSGGRKFLRLTYDDAPAIAGLLPADARPTGRRRAYGETPNTTRRALRPAKAPAAADEAAAPRVGDVADALPSLIVG